MKKYQEWNSGISKSISSLVDVSSFLLIESTGDSEFDSNFCSSTSDDPIMDDSLITLNSSRRRFLEDDDAQSCSYEECGHVVDDDDDEDMDDMNIKIENDDHNGDDDDDDVVDSSRWCHGYHRKHVGWNKNIMMEEDDDDEVGVVEQGNWMNGGVNNKCKNNYVNSVVVDNEFKSQKDKDKHFWETCLAS